MTKAATVYKRPNGLYLHSESRTTAGVWLATPPFLRIALDASDTRKGEAVAEVLEGSRDSIEHPTEWTDDPFCPMLETAGVKSWGTFAKNASSVGIEVEQGRLTLTPGRNLGPKEGFEPIPDKACTLPFPLTKEEIGAALESVLKQCE